MAKHFPRRDRQNQRQQQTEAVGGHDAQQQPAQQRTEQGACGHTQQQRAMGAQHGERRAFAVAGKSHDHGRQRHQQRQAARELEVQPPQQHDGRNQQLAPGHAHHRGEQADHQPGGDASSRVPPGRQNLCEIGQGAQAEHLLGRHGAGQQNEQNQQHAIERLARQAHRPARGPPSAEQTARQQVEHHGPMRQQNRQRHGVQPGDDRHAHHQQRQRLVGDHRLQRRQTEQPDQHRQTKLRPAQADQAAEQPDGQRGEKATDGTGRIAGRGAGGGDRRRRVHVIAPPRRP